MLKKIISGGQTGADRAALDAAIELGIPHGGWIPKGRRTEGGPLPDKYELKEMATPSYEERTEQNVIDSDGTLIVSHGQLTDGSAFTDEMAKKHERPCLHIDLDVIRGISAAQEIKSWILQNGVKTLNVAGPRASKAPEIHDDTVRMVKAVYYLFLIDHKQQQLPKPLYPRTVDDAVDRLVSEVPLKDKILIAKMDNDELHVLDKTLGTYLLNNYGLQLQGGELMKDCRYFAKNRDLEPDEAPALIIEEFWKQVRETHLPRVVK